jgi:hypothetical protein
MLIVEVDAPQAGNYYISQNTSRNVKYLRTGFVLTFRLINPLDNILDNAPAGSTTMSAYNLSAYRTAEGRLAGAGNAAGAGATATSINYPWEHFQSLTTEISHAPTTENPLVRDDNISKFDTRYADSAMTFPKPATALTGIQKRVMAENDILYNMSTEVPPGGKFCLECGQKM